MQQGSRTCNACPIGTLHQIQILLAHATANTFGLTVLLLPHSYIDTISILAPPQCTYKKLYKAYLKSNLKNESIHRNRMHSSHWPPPCSTSMLGWPPCLMKQLMRKTVPSLLTRNLIISWRFSPSSRII